MRACGPRTRQEASAVRGTRLECGPRAPPSWRRQQLTTQGFRVARGPSLRVQGCVGHGIRYAGPIGIG